MLILKSSLLGLWLSSFGTLAYLYLSIYRRIPSGTAVAANVFAVYTTYNLFWWAGVAASFVLAFYIVKAWPGNVFVWATVAITELVPVGLVVMFLMLAARNREVIERMGAK
jgi:hypothetical protein